MNIKGLNNYCPKQITGNLFYYLSGFLAHATEPNKLPKDGFLLPVNDIIYLLILRIITAAHYYRTISTQPAIFGVPFLRSIT